MRHILVIWTIIILAGCAGTGDSTRQDIKAQEYYERTARECDAVVIKRTGTRIRKPINREALLSARCIK